MRTAELDQAAEYIAAELQAGRDVRINETTVLTVMDMEETAWCDNTDTETAAEKLADRYVRSHVDYMRRTEL